MPPPTRRDLRRAARRTTVGKIFSRIAKFADIRADRGSLQIQRFGNLSFWAALPPQPYKQSVAFSFARSFARQEFRRRERAAMPARHPGEQLGEADLQGAREPDHREDPEVAGAALEIDKVAPTHRRPVAKSLLREISPASSPLGILPQAAERWLRLWRSILHMEQTGGRVPDDPGGDEPTPHIEASGQSQDEGHLRYTRPSPLDLRQVREVRLGCFGELFQAQAGFLTVTGDVGTEPQRYLLSGGAAAVGWIESTRDRRRVPIGGSRFTDGAASPCPLVNTSCRPAAIAERLPTLPEPVDGG